LNLESFLNAVNDEVYDTFSCFDTFCRPGVFTESAAIAELLLSTRDAAQFDRGMFLKDAIQLTVKRLQDCSAEMLADLFRSKRADAI
jgi:hypothetical protein